jgi:acyl carrier protein
MSELIVDQLKEIIAYKLDVNLGIDEIDENVSLYEDGLGLDSIAIVDLITTIEKEFSLEFDDEELNPELFKNLSTLARFIQPKFNRNLPHGMGDLYAAQVVCVSFHSSPGDVAPHGMGDLYAAQTGCVGFHSSTDEGASEPF